jgi:hypothetical protein
MPIYKTKNQNFFKKWTPEMAYVLGFFTADGNMLKNKRGAHFIEFQITDKKLLQDIRNILGSNHKISVIKRNSKWKTVYRLQIGSKEVFNDLLKIGLTPNKSKTIKLPKIPDKYFQHFTRGYFDGDGNVLFGYFKKSDRKSRSPILLTRFTSGSKSILKSLKIKLKDLIKVNGSLYCKKDDSSQLSYSTNDSKKIFNFIYNDGKIKKLIYLKRKYNIYLKAMGR